MLPSQRPEMSAPELGDAIGERYRLDHEAGRSEAGVVFDATDRSSGRRVAVEVASSIEEPRARLCWARDAMLAQRLEGEHVLHVYDVGTLLNGAPFAVRESAPSTLATELEARGPMAVQEAVGITLEACEALAEAHAIGLAHGDLRLENVHLARTESGRSSVKVAWTTAAKAERAAKQDVERDIAALGALLRTLVIGRVENDQDGAATLPSGVLHAISTALGQEPQRAFTNVAEFARALQPSAPAGNASVANIASFMSRAAMPSVTDEWFGQPLRREVGATLAPVGSKRGRSFAVVSLALIGFVLGGSWFLWQNGQLPHWTGAAPPDEPVGTTNVTSSPAPAEPASEPVAVPAEEPTTSTPVQSLPNAAAALPTFVRKAEPAMVPTSASLREPVPASAPTTSDEPTIAGPAPTTDPAPTPSSPSEAY